MKRVLLISCFCLIVSSAYAQNYVIKKQAVVSGGGQISSSSYKLNSMAGYQAMADLSSENYRCDLGFWPVVLEFIESDYAYIPGDANMAAGLWQPSVIGADVTYLVNYFRGNANSCLIDGFYISADVNGDCMVIGSDVSFLVNYFRGLNPLRWCADYPPAWPPLPSSAPSGWPNCE